MIAKEKGLAAELSTATASAESSQFDDFYRRFFLPLVRRSTWKHGLDKEDARDVVQDAFMIALAKLDPQRNPKAWLIQVVDHLSLNFQRKVVRRSKLVSRWSPAGVLGAGAPLESEDGLGDSVDDSEGMDHG